MSASRGRAVWAMVATSAVAAWVAFAQVPPAGPPAPAAPRPSTPAPPPAVATVGDLRIARAELEERAAQAAAEYRGRTGSELPAEVAPVMRRQMLESLIRRNLLVLEARRRGLLGSEAEAVEELKRDPFFRPGGRFDAARFEQVRVQQPQAFATAVGNLRVSIGARQLLERLQTEKGPDAAELRARARRDLTRATLDYLVLRTAEFDGGYPEPRESDVLEYHRGHAAEFERPARAVLSVVFVDQPALADSELARPDLVRAWTAQRRQKADSILAAVRGGAALDSAAADMGGARGNQSVLRENFPGYWKGGPETRAAVFAARPGSVLPEPVPAERGWLVVRVDEVFPAHTAALREVAQTIRGRLRDERRRNSEERELRALYERLRDSLAVTGYRVRYGVADTAGIAVPPPTATEVERFYRSHLADYSAFSSRAGGVVARGLDEVRDEVRTRVERERRTEVARAMAERVHAAWARGRRDTRAEQALRVREVGPVVPGAAADTGSAGVVLGDSLKAREGLLGAGIGRAPRGWIVFDVLQAVPGHVLTFEQARARLAQRRAAERAAEEEREARRIFDADPDRFAGGARIHYTRAFVRPANPIAVELNRGEVLRYHREHLDQFTAPELVQARHILISPRDETPGADREARARADSLLARLRAGEDFAEMAARVTDDPATRANGGDLGQFGRGAMLPEVERAAFALRAGEMTAEPVRSQVGYHILKVTEYVPLASQPLSQIWGDIGWAAASAKADSVAQRRADSLLRVVRDAAGAKAAVKRLNLGTLSYVHRSGERQSYPQDLQAYYQRLETLRPGQVLPLRPGIGGMGYAVTWVDSIVPPGRPSWEEGRQRALDEYRAGAGRRMLEAKKAELDSLLAGGWSFDSLGAVWGGLQHAREVQAGQRIPGIGTGGRVDTLVFGRRGDDGQPVGTVSAWQDLPSGATRVRTVAIRLPEANEVATRAETEGRVENERALAGTFEALKQRYPVRILDRTLRDVALPQPPPAR